MWAAGLTRAFSTYPSGVHFEQSCSSQLQDFSRPLNSKQVSQLVSSIRLVVTCSMVHFSGSSEAACGMLWNKGTLYHAIAKSDICFRIWRLDSNNITQICVTAKFAIFTLTVLPHKRLFLLRSKSNDSFSLGFSYKPSFLQSRSADQICSSISSWGKSISVFLTSLLSNSKTIGATLNAICWGRSLS